jgi:Fis family transcriptional regulator
MSENPPTSIDDCIRAAWSSTSRTCAAPSPTAARHDPGAVEKPLLEVVLRTCRGQPEPAAEWLGINRNTLRRKLLDHKLIK